MNVTKSPLIHIGFPKCASTSIQRNFFSSCQELKYLGHEMKSNRLNKMALDALISLTTLSKYDFVKQEKSITYQIYDYLQNTSSVAISSEFFTASHYSLHVLYSWQDISIICERLWRLFPEAKILIIIRNQLDVWPSYFSEILKQPNLTIKWKDFIDRAIDLNERGYGSVLCRYNYYQAYKTYVDFFGKCNVDVMLMEDIVAAPHEFLQKLINLCNLSKLVSASNFTLKKENTRTTRWDRYKKGVMRFVPETVDKSLKKNSAAVGLDNMIKKISGIPAYKLSSDRKAYLIKFYQSENKLLADETGLNLKAAGYPHP